MRKYYIFLIDPYVINSYINHADSLYDTMKKICFSNIFIYNRISMYKKITKMIDKQILTNYIEHKFKNIKKGKNKYIINVNKETCIIKVNYSGIILYTNKNYSIMFDILKIMNKNFFVCDFINNDYFFINKISNKLIFKTYN